MYVIPTELTRIYTFLLLLTVSTHSIAAIATTAVAQELVKGFTATPDSSVTSFQPLLSDSVGNYSLGFLRVDKTQLALAVIHNPSQEQLWAAGNGLLTRWSSQTRFSFNGSLVISDARTGALWSSHTEGDRVRLTNTSNLIIEKGGDSSSIIWQSFDFPYNTLMENQNFTSDMTLVSSNGLYSMKLGSDFIGFYAKFARTSPDPGHLYFQHNPMEAKARVMEGGGPIWVVVSPDGFLGMYQNGTAPVDVQPFSSFQQPGMGNRRVRLEPDGNLIGYYWARSSWLVDFKQVSDQCDLPSSCGPYGMCQRGKGCSCLDNQTEYTSGRCDTEEIRFSENDLCRKKYKVLRRIGVELPNKEIMGYTIMSSLEKCEVACEQKCTCWGAVYSNTSRFCYTIDYPIQTLVEVLDDTKVGYFKVKESSRKHHKLIGLWVGLGLFFGLVLLSLGIGGVFLYKRESRGVKGYVEDDGLNGGVGPYKNLGSSSSIELSVR